MAKTSLERCDLSRKSADADDASDSNVRGIAREAAGDDREWLLFEISRAAKAVFPESERLGKSAQQDFYFRGLLEILLDNVRDHGVPVAGGTYSDIWELTQRLAPRWRARAEARRGRASYARQSMKTLVHEWKRAFQRRERVYSQGSTIVFTLEGPDHETDDVVLRATIDGVLPNRRRVTIRELELSSATRLPSGRAADDNAENEERERLLADAKRFTRRVEAEYLSRLSGASIEFLRNEVEELKRARHDYRRMGAAILVVVGTAMLAYRIVHVKDATPNINFGPEARRTSNFAVDPKGRIALLDDEGHRISDWGNSIVDEHGVRALPKSPGKDTEVQVLTKGVNFTFAIPERWHDHPERVLADEGSCVPLVNPPRSVVCVHLVDLRAFRPPKAASAQLEFGFNFGDGPQTELAEMSRINPIPSRVLLRAQHLFLKRGTYDSLLIVRTASKTQHRVNPPGPDEPKFYAERPLVRFVVNDRSVAVARIPGP